MFTSFAFFFSQLLEIILLIFPPPPPLPQTRLLGIALLGKWIELYLQDLDSEPPVLFGFSVVPGPLPVRRSFPVPARPFFFIQSELVEEKLAAPIFPSKDNH